MNNLFYIKKAIAIILIIASVKAGAQNCLFHQGFEGEACENWNYNGGAVVSGVQRTGSHSARIGNTSNTLLFSPADVTGYSGLVLSIYHSVKPGPGPGMDTREGAVIQASINGGAYVTIGSTGGYEDASWGFNSPSGGSNTGSSGCNIYTSPNPIVLNIPDGSITVQVKVVSVRAGSCSAFNNAISNATPNLYDRSDEGFYIDDVQITATTPLPSVELISAAGTDNQQINSCIPTAITDIQYSTGYGFVDITGLPSGVTYTYAAGVVTIIGSPLADGLYNYIVTNMCADSSATGSIIKNTPQPLTQTTDLIGCKEIIVNGIAYTSSIVLNDTLRSYQGCDSIYNITNVIITPITPVTQTTNLNGCNAVTFNGITYTSSIVLNDTLRSYQGCDSVFKVTNIVVARVVPITQTTSLSGCNAVIFNGVNYTSSTLLNDTLRSYQGCDSVFKVTDIIITAIIPVIENTTLSGCNNVIFNGTNYSASVTLKDTLKSYQGCDSVFKVTNILVNLILPITQRTVLTGCNAVAFNGIIYTSSTIWRDTIRSFQGCDSVYKITNIIITAVATATQTNNLIGCNTVNFNGVNYYSSVILSDTLRSFQGCDSIYKITNIRILPFIPITQDTTINGCSKVIFNDMIYTSNTEINDTIKSIGGCDSIYLKATIIVTHESFILNLTSSANTINPGLPVTLSTSSFSNYDVLSWQPSSAFSLQSVKSQNIFTDTSITITVTATSSEGCIGNATFMLIVNKLQDDIYFPTAFNPNSNVGNRTFGPLGQLSLLKDYSFYIYNRWGDVVFSSSDPFQKWNGSYKGALSGPGNFVWQASYLYKGVFKKIQRGNVLLIK